MINELMELVKYVESKGEKVSFVTDGELKDYAGMNPQASKVMGYEDIDHNEILIDGKLDLETQVHNLRHEIIEKNLMKAGMKYYPAHVISLKLESVDLMGKELDVLDKLGLYDVDRIKKDSVTVKSKGMIYNIKNGKREPEKMYVIPEKVEEKPQKEKVKPKPIKRIKSIVKSLTMK